MLQKLNGHHETFKLVDMHEIDEISLTLGKLVGGQEGINKRIDELDSKISVIVDSMHKLPPSPDCVTKHGELEEAIASLKESRARNGGMLVAGGAVVAVFVDWVANKIGITWGN